MSNEFPFNVKSDKLEYKHMREANGLLKRMDEILDVLAEKGMREDEETPYTYFVPTGVSFDFGDGSGRKVCSVCAVVEMARASYSEAFFLGDNDAETDEELKEAGAVDDGFVRVNITDPFAMKVETAIRLHHDKMIALGKARVVNCRFFKVA